jgi:hypothetical protein
MLVEKAFGFCDKDETLNRREILCQSRLERFTGNAI